jgi:hypothetical protein
MGKKQTITSKTITTNSSCLPTWKKPNKLLKFCIFLILAVIIYKNYTDKLLEHTFHEDEQHFTRKSYYFDLFFIHPNLTDERWYKYDSPSQPKFGPYIYGIIFHLNGIDDLQQEINQLSYGDYRWVMNLKNRPLDPSAITIYPQLKLIFVARKVAVYFTFIAFLIIFYFALKTKGFIFALTATAMLSENELMLMLGKRAMTDSLQLLGFYAVISECLLFAYYDNQKKENRLAWLGFALGATCAFTVGVKVSGILSVIFLIAFFSLVLFKRSKENRTTLPIIHSAILSFITFVLIFLPLHPYLYKDPLGQFVSMFYERIKWAEYMRLVDSSSAVYSKFTAITLILYRTLMPYGRMANFRHTPWPIDAFLFLAGLWTLGRNASKAWQNQRTVSGELLLFIWNTVVILSLIWYLRNDWDRYYLPVVSTITITQAYALTSFVQILKNLVTKPFSKFKFARVS